MTAYPFWSWITWDLLTQVLLRSFLFRRLSFRSAGSDGSEGRFSSSEVAFKPRSSPMLLVVKQRQKRMRTLIKKQALDTRTCSPGAGDRGRTGTVSLPSDFENCRQLCKSLHSVAVYGRLSPIFRAFQASQMQTYGKSGKPKKRKIRWFGRRVVESNENKAGRKKKLVETW